ncbi:MAG TPA: hypothetical protein VIO61_07475 [Anaerolineaceae bacterium]
MDTGQVIIYIVTGILVIWYIGGMIINRNRGLQVYRWLRSGLRQIGEQVDSQFIGSSSSAGRMVIQKAKMPLRQVEVFYLLETRELLPLWLVNWLMGKRDEFIFKATLSTAPANDLEVGLKGNREYRKATNGAEPAFQEAPEAPPGYQMAYRPHPDARLAERLPEFLERYPLAVQHLSLQAKEPHLIVRVHLENVLRVPSEAFFKDLSGLFR